MKYASDPKLKKYFRYCHEQACGTHGHDHAHEDSEAHRQKEQEWAQLQMSRKNRVPFRNGAILGGCFTLMGFIFLAYFAGT